MTIGSVGIWVAQDSGQEKQLFHMYSRDKEIQFSYVLILAVDIVIDSLYECLASVA